jgi:hypothetical protein
VSPGLCAFVVEIPGLRIVAGFAVTTARPFKTLYVGESDTREIRSYRIDGTSLLSPWLVRRFADFDVDGLRTDTPGNLYVARILKGTIAGLTPAGKLKREIALKAKEPTNLAFGGTDGKTVFVTQRQGGFCRSVPGRLSGPRVLFCHLCGSEGTQVNFR